MKRLFVTGILFSLVLWVYPAQADIATGLAWLAGQAQSNGAYASNTNLATPVQATAETLRTFQALGEAPAGIFAARQFLSAEPFDNTEYLARKIIAGIAASEDVSMLVTELLTHQNSDGGFGDFAGHQSTMLDTAFALDALAMMGSADTSLVDSAVSFLLDRQRPDGGWADNENATSAFLSAQILRSLWHYRQVFAVTPALDGAQAFLLAQRGGSVWQEILETALALIAIAPRLSDTSSIADSLAVLANAQLADGSWQGDVYTTALALRALALAETPLPNPDLATLTGQVVHGETGLALVGAMVELIGLTNIRIVTDASGVFTLTALDPGLYQLNVVAPGFAPLSVSVSLSTGETLDLGDLSLLYEIDVNVGAIQGVVSDQNGLPLTGAIVRVGAATVVTGTDGKYRIDSVPPGSITVTVESAGYASAITSGHLLAGGLFIFSPHLTAFPNGVPPPAAIYGIVTDFVTGEPIESVGVWVSGTNYIPTKTAADGTYRLEPVTPGEVRVTFSMSGYQYVYASLTVVEGAQIELSPRMFVTRPPDAYSHVTGVVVDATTGAPLVDALVNATHGNTTETLATDAVGRFTVVGISETEVVLTISHSGYVRQTLTLPVPPWDEADAGQIRLRPEALGPDLAPTTLNTAELVTDLTTLTLSGILEVTVENRGNRPPTGSFSVTAFYDADDDGQQENNEPELGSAVVDGTLATGESLTQAIYIQGILPFRDAPITVVVDSERHIVETNETNNWITSAALCRLPTTVIEPGALPPTLKYQWGYAAAAPVVVPLEDTNLDGLIDEQDIPSVVYVFNGVTAQSGVDGRMLWNTRVSASSSTNIAAGDLDNDGLVEIVAGDPLYKMVVLEHTGEIKYEIQDLDNRLNWGGYALADLDGDGAPEIVAGTTVYNAQDGSVRWRGEGGFVAGFTNGRDRYPFSIVADLDLDGRPELISGASAFDADGQLLWANENVGDGYVAVGNFDDTPEPEVVVVGRIHYVDGHFTYQFPYTVHLLNHRGEVIWGPVRVPADPRWGYNGNTAGPPTIADLDGDGLPEITVGGRERLSAFDTDGSLMWTTPTYEESSGLTGAAVFDFDGDGRAEVVYADEREFRLYRGVDGAVLFKTESWSATYSEMPIIVDLDRDGHAEVLVPASPLKVYANDNWVPTRHIWNQHTYHITNVNDDGTVPRHEKPSWLSHNTYRLNTFPDRDPLDQSDLSVSLLTLIDNGLGQPQSLTARIGNAGSLSLTQTIPVAFYQGDPAAGGVLLGTVTLDGLARGAYADVRLEEVTLASLEPLYVWVDPDDQYRECNEANNQMSRSLSDVAPLGQLRVATDAAEYGANAPVLLQATVTNTGSFISDYTVILAIVDGNGALVTQFDAQPVSALSAGGSLTLSQAWNTGVTLAGNYTVHGILSTPEGQILGEAAAEFSIGAGGAPPVTLHTTTDRATYHTTDTVQITYLVRNATTNTLLSGIQIEIQITGPQGQLLFSETLHVGELSPGGQHERTIAVPLNQAAPGDYHLDAQVEDAAGNELARAATAITVQSSAETGAGLTGVLTVTPLSVRWGEPLTLQASLTNQGNSAFTALPVRITLLDPAAQTILTDWLLTVAALPIGGVTPVAVQWAAQADAGVYSAVLSVNIDGTPHTLDHATFEIVDAPPSNAPPVADAGADRQTRLGEPVVLNGSGSYDPDGQLLSFHWTLLAQPPASTLTATALQLAADPAPRFIPDVVGQYQLQLLVSDGLEDSAPDTVLITAVTGNVPPQANAGPDRAVALGEFVTLDGRASADPDEGPVPLSYEWRFAERPPTSQLTDQSIGSSRLAQATFVPDVPGLYRLELAVTDGEATITDEARITVALLDIPPNADAGPDAQASLDQPVTLDGSASYDPDYSPEPLRHAWQWVFLPPASRLSQASIEAVDTPTPWFIADTLGSYVLRLTVSDGAQEASDNVLITVVDREPTPIADLVALAKDSKIDLLWTPVTDAVSYTILRSTTSGGSYALLQTGHVTGYGAFADFGLTNGVQYCYVVRWVDATGHASPDSNEACATPTGRRPGR
ncbi:MAG: carboxypeptidase regulatory-like domain-containing protein [Gammaproteobacteria bacterium]|nr:carboxypeptidase regulatory-like domain-containing protein [Gammaproteobacteria bacterium]MCP5198020.1 carboxypeptidase regulatory-like domain-containing protein [Gammaproteobacteria bacterium]